MALGAGTVANAQAAGVVTGPLRASLGASAPAAGKTAIKFFGHSSFSITTPSGKVIYIDPWLKNPLNAASAEADLTAAKAKCDAIAISHGHFDHVGEAVEIAKASGAVLCGMLELGLALAGHLGYPRDKATMVTLGNLGGATTILDGEVTITLVPALHSSSLTVPEAGEPAGSDKTQTVTAGSPTGLVIAIKGGPTIYHTGDTEVFSDMALIGQLHKPDIMLVCIGDHFTMGPKAAALATKLVAPQTVVPIHHSTFPLLTGTPAAFEAELKSAGAKAAIKVLKAGEVLES
ncbi:metal-dependent hydrolase [Verrucomicrobia bacterium LW23]|nr:metal-dependent hydrolase [Verrucomicrobia bacterium LW23]